MDHLDDVARYIEDVLSGKKPACKYVKQALTRQVEDLKRTDLPWEFSQSKARRICNFIEKVPHIQGPLKGRRAELQLWQKFIVSTVFGWVNPENNYRRFREVYIEVPRGNGKSFITSPIGLYLLGMDDEGGAEVYSAATTRDQAKKVFVIAQEMARSMGDFRAKFGVEVSAHSINQGVSYFRALSSDANTLDGLNIHGALIDEFHAHKTRDLYDVLKTACAKRAQPLIWEITTAGSDRAGVCYEQRSYVTRILDGSAKDDRTFGIIYTIDDDDPWDTIQSAEKANPNWGISVFKDAIEAELHQALQIAAKQYAYQTKHLNRWVNADIAWMDMQRWAKCADRSLKVEQFANQDCVVGVDVGNKRDIFAKLRIFWQDIDGRRHYTVFGDYWTPQDTIDISPNSQYRGWALDGYLHACKGGSNDFDWVENDIRADCRRFNVLEVAMDPYHATPFINHLAPEGIVVVEVPQVTKNLSEPMKELEAAVYDGRFHFDGDPVLTWAVSNVVCHIDKNDNLFPNKERQDNKIDPIQALLTGMNRVMAAPEEVGSVYETRGPIFV